MKNNDSMKHLFGKLYTCNHLLKGKIVEKRIKIIKRLDKLTTIENNNIFYLIISYAIFKYSLMYLNPLKYEQKERKTGISLESI